MHVNKDRTKVHLVHFPRDLYVPIPGHGKDKINAAYAYGGAPLLVRTIQDLVDVPIDHVGLIGFEGFKAMTDAVGGVKVYAEESQHRHHQGLEHAERRRRRWPSSASATSSARATSPAAGASRPSSRR